MYYNLLVSNMLKIKIRKSKITLFLIGIFFLFSSDWATAQPTEKLKIDTESHATAVGEYYLENSSRFFVIANYQRGNEIFGRLGNTPFSERNLEVGYEHFLKEKWQFGISYIRYKGANTGRDDYYKAYGRHNGRIRSLIFSKELSFSFLNEVDEPFLYEHGNNTKVGISAYLGKRYKLGNLTMQTGVAYEISRWHESFGDRRTLNETELSLKHHILLGKQLVLELFAIRQTQYFFAEESIRFDKDGNILEQRPYRKLNLFTPIYGISLRLALNPQKANKELPFNLWAEK